jgi:hypothetical protein
MTEPVAQSATAKSEGFNCRCGGYMEARRTVRLTNRIARERHCVECGDVMSTVEMPAREQVEKEYSIISEVIVKAVFSQQNRPFR